MSPGEIVIIIGSHSLCSIWQQNMPCYANKLGAPAELDRRFSEWLSYYLDHTDLFRTQQEQAVYDTTLTHGAWELWEANGLALASELRRYISEQIHIHYYGRGSEAYSISKSLPPQFVWCGLPPHVPPVLPAPLVTGSLVRVSPDYGGAYIWYYGSSCAEHLTGNSKLREDFEDWQLFWECNSPVPYTEEERQIIEHRYSTGFWLEWEAKGIALCRRLKSKLPKGVNVVFEATSRGDLLITEDAEYPLGSHLLEEDS
jgi:hypothetical protein